MELPDAHYVCVFCLGQSQASAFGTYRASGIGYKCAEKQAASYTKRYILRDEAGLLLSESDPFTRTGAVFDLRFHLFQSRKSDVAKKLSAAAGTDDGDGLDF